MAASDFRPETPLFPRTHRGYLDPTERCLMLSTHGISTPTEEFVWGLAVTMNNLCLSLRRPRDVQGPGGTPPHTLRTTLFQGRSSAPREPRGADTPASPSPNSRGTPSPDPSMSNCRSRAEGSSPPRGALAPDCPSMTLRSGRRVGSQEDLRRPYRNRKEYLRKD